MFWKRSKELMRKDFEIIHRALERLIGERIDPDEPIHTTLTKVERWLAEH